MKNFESVLTENVRKCLNISPNITQAVYHTLLQWQIEAPLSKNNSDKFNIKKKDVELHKQAKTTVKLV